MKAQTLPPCPVSPDSLKGIPRQQTNHPRWDGKTWSDFVHLLGGSGIGVKEDRATCTLYLTDGGGISCGLPHGVFAPRSADEISAVLKAAQKYKVPVTVKGGGLTTEGESVAPGGLQLDMRRMNRVLAIDEEKMTVRTEAGIFWHTLGEALRKHGLDYLSAPLNMTSTVGGTLNVGGIDINSPRLGCSADQALSLKVITPTGEIKECSENENHSLFERVLFGYGQFGIIAEATMKIRRYAPISLHYFYYGSLREAMEDLVTLVRADAADYIGILTILDRAVNLLVAFDSDGRKNEFFDTWRKRIRGYGETGFTFRTAFHYAMRPWKYREALYLYDRKRELLPDLNPGHHMENGKIQDRTVVFSRAVWKYWGGSRMVIPDLATSEEKFIEAVIRGNRVCRKYFPHYTLYCVGIKLSGWKERYELSCIPPDARDFAYGCEFEPMLEGKAYSRDYLQSFKNEIYDIGVDMGTSYYRFGGMMKGYIRRVFGDELVDRHLRMKMDADPAMVLNSHVVF